MNIELVVVERDEKEILRNLMEKYDYEMSQYGNDDVNKLGLYGFDYFDNYWQEGAKRWAYFIKVDGKLAGFAMFISDYFYLKDKKSDYMMNDFFVMYKYRGLGVGKSTMGRQNVLHTAKKAKSMGYTVHLWYI